MPRVILLVPFIRHYAGSVFDLGDETGLAGWDPDERARERLSFVGKAVYFLPDGGNGLSAELPLGDTVICPPEIFEGVDLFTGPCRATGAWAQQGDAAPQTIDRELATPVDIGGAPKQGLHITLPADAPRARQALLTDRTSEKELRAWPWQTLPFVADLSGLGPGFYRLRIVCDERRSYVFSVIKCFPLVVQYDRASGRHTTTETVW